MQLNLLKYVIISLFSCYSNTQAAIIPYQDNQREIIIGSTDQKAIVSLPPKTTTGTPDNKLVLVIIGDKWKADTQDKIIKQETAFRKLSNDFLKKYPNIKTSSIEYCDKEAELSEILSPKKNPNAKFVAYSFDEDSIALNTFINKHRDAFFDAIIQIIPKTKTPPLPNLNKVNSLYNIYSKAAGSQVTKQVIEQISSAWNYVVAIPGRATGATVAAKEVIAEGVKEVAKTFTESLPTKTTLWSAIIGATAVASLFPGSILAIPAFCIGAHTGAKIGNYSEQILHETSATINQFFAKNTSRKEEQETQEGTTADTITTPDDETFNAITPTDRKYAQRLIKRGTPDKQYFNYPIKNLRILAHNETQSIQDISLADLKSPQFIEGLYNLITQSDLYQINFDLIALWQAEKNPIIWINRFVKYTPEEKTCDFQLGESTQKVNLLKFDYTLLPQPKTLSPMESYLTNQLTFEIVFNRTTLLDLLEKISKIKETTYEALPIVETSYQHVPVVGRLMQTWLKSYSSNTEPEITMLRTIEEAQKACWYPVDTFKRTPMHFYATTRISDFMNTFEKKHLSNLQENINSVLSEIHTIMKIEDLGSYDGGIDEFNKNTVSHAIAEGLSYQSPNNFEQSIQSLLGENQADKLMFIMLIFHKLNEINQYAKVTFDKYGESKKELKNNNGKTAIDLLKRNIEHINKAKGILFQALGRYFSDNNQPSDNFNQIAHEYIQQLSNSDEDDEKRTIENWINNQEISSLETSSGRDSTSPEQGQTSPKPQSKPWGQWLLRK